MTKLKICGLFRPCDVKYVNQVKPDWCGFVINFPKSHRSLTPKQVRALRPPLDPAVTPVGVFVNQPLETVAGLLRDGTISITQLHGREDEAYIAALRAAVPGCVVWKAFQIRSAVDLDAANASTADLVILDNGYGTGETFDWTLAGGVTRPYLLAGGLTPENIPAAIAQLHPYGLDLSSGVETDQKKDFDKMQAAATAAEHVSFS